MLTLYTNRESSERSRPLLTTSRDLIEYLEDGDIPQEAETLPVPEHIAVTDTCIWIRPDIAIQSWASLCLVCKLQDDNAERLSLLPVKSGKKRAEAYLMGDKVMVGWVDNINGTPILKPLTPDSFTPVLLDNAKLIGTVEAML